MISRGSRRSLTASSIGEDSAESKDHGTFIFLYHLEWNEENKRWNVCWIDLLSSRSITTMEMWEQPEYSWARWGFRRNNWILPVCLWGLEKWRISLVSSSSAMCLYWTETTWLERTDVRRRAIRSRKLFEKKITNYRCVVVLSFSRLDLLWLSKSRNTRTTLPRAPDARRWFIGREYRSAGCRDGVRCWE